jgi:hypothetical protein
MTILVHLKIDGKAKMQGGTLMSNQDRSCNVRLDSRCQDENGEIRRKRGDTLVGTLRETYGEDFAHGYRSDTKLKTLLEREGTSSLSHLLRRKSK